MTPDQNFENYPVFGDNATKVKPDDAKYAAGFQQADVLPAEWMNWAWNKNTQGIKELQEGLASVEAEINRVLTEAQIAPDAEATNQLIQSIIAVIAANNAASADKLKTKRKINGTDFDGSAAITTESWGTKRTVTVSDNSGTNTQANADVDGSANFTLKLPSTIKANITGNCSGSSGSCTGNAATATSAAACTGNAATATSAAACTGNSATATKLAATKNINGTAFDGSSNITTASWGTKRTVTISDNSGTNSQANADVDGSANFTLKLPSTIKASITGNCSGSSGSCSGNAATATKLAATKNINGSAFDGSADITTSKWGTARTVTISDNSGTNTQANTSIDGSANFTLKLPSTIKASITGNCSGSSGSCTGNAANVTGTVAVANGGTGATTAAAARTNLGLGSAATQNSTAFLGATATAADSTKLGGKSVQTTAFTDQQEHTNYWAYITKSKFTLTSGYLVLSNGLIIQWGTVDASSSNTSVQFPVTYTKGYCPFFGYQSDNSNGMNHRALGVYALYNTALSLTGFTVYGSSVMRKFWLTVGY